MIDDPATYFARNGIQYKQSKGKNGRELLVDCPSCGRDGGKCSVNSKTWKWQCFVCKATGGEVTFKRERGDLYAVTNQAEDDAEKHRDEAFAQALLAKRSRTQVERWRDALQADPAAEAARAYLVEERLITLETAKRLLIGWSATRPTSTSKPAKAEQKPRRRRRRASASEVQPEPDSAPTGPGWLTIPSFTRHTGLGPDPESCAMVKLRSVPPAEKEYRRITGGESILYAPGGIDPKTTLLVVGGELDAAVIHQIGHTNVVAGTTGESGWSDVWTKQLEDCEDIVVIYDADGTGQAGAEELSKTLGQHRTRIGHWPEPYNDANAALIGLGADVFDIFHVESVIASARSALAKGINRIDESLRTRYKRRLLGGENRGVSSGWPHFDDSIGGVRWGEVTVVTGDTSSGKTTFISELALKMAQPVAASTDSALGGRAAIPTLVMPFESGDERQLDKWVRQVSTHPPDELSEEQIDETLDALEAMPLWVMRHYGKFKAEALRNTLIYAARRLGVKFVVLDHLHFMVDEGGEQEREQISAICMVCAEVAQSEGMHVVLVAHPHGTGSSKDKDRDNRIVQLGDLKGSSAIKQIADNALSVWKPRNATREGIADDQGYGESIVYVLKARSDYGSEGSVPFMFWIRAARYIDPDSNIALFRRTDTSGPSGHKRHWMDDD